MPINAKPSTIAVINTFPDLRPGISSERCSKCTCMLKILCDIQKKIDKKEQLDSSAGVRQAQELWLEIDGIEDEVRSLERELDEKEGKELLQFLAGNSYEKSDLKRIMDIQKVLLEFDCEKRNEKRNEKRSSIMRYIMQNKTLLSMDFLLILYQQEWLDMQKQYARWNDKGQVMNGDPLSLANKNEFLNKLKRDWPQAADILTKDLTLKQEETSEGISERALKLDDFDTIIDSIPEHFSRDNIEEILTGSIATTKATVNRQGSPTPFVAESAQREQEKSGEPDTAATTGVGARKQQDNPCQVVVVVTALQTVLLSAVIASVLIARLQVAFPFLAPVSIVTGLLSAVVLKRWGKQSQSWKSFGISYIGCIILSVSYLYPAVHCFYMVQPASLCLVISISFSLFNSLKKDSASGFVDGHDRCVSATDLRQGDSHDTTTVKQPPHTSRSPEPNRV